MKSEISNNSIKKKTFYSKTFLNPGLPEKMPPKRIKLRMYICTQTYAHPTNTTFLYSLV